MAVTSKQICPGLKIFMIHFGELRQREYNCTLSWAHFIINVSAQQVAFVNV